MLGIHLKPWRKVIGLWEKEGRAEGYVEGFVGGVSLP
jgi:hypothetical protein